jgi:hypothetical protein
MRPILIFAIAAIAASAIGVGALNNEIILAVQQFGVGSSEITSPINAAKIDFEITPVTVVNATDPTKSIIKNLITGCSFHSDESIEAPEDELQGNDPYIICKLSDDGKIVAEGNYTLPNGYISSDRLIVPMSIYAYPGSNDFRNINDVHLIVVGTDVTVVQPVEAP